MYKTAFIAVTSFASAFGAHVVQAQSYQIDASHTAIIFSVSHLGYSYTYGRFNKVEGAFSLSAENPAASQFALSIDASSIDTNDAKRDEHLRGPDFFNVKQFPTLTFQSTSVRPSADGLEVVGNLTLHGVTQQVTLPMKKLGEGPGPYGNYRLGYVVQTRIKRSQFGMTNMLPAIGDDIAITISFEGIRQ